MDDPVTRGGWGSHRSGGTSKAELAVIAATVLFGALAIGFGAGLLVDRWTGDGQSAAVNSAGSEVSVAPSPAVPAVVPTGVGTAPTAPASTTKMLTFETSSDTYVNSDKPNTSYGDADTLRIDSQPQVISYVRFDVSGLPGATLRATLRLYAVSPSIQGFLVQGVDPAGWEDSQLTFASQPTGDVKELGSSGPFDAETWPGVDVTRYVTGNGEYSFAIVGISRTAVSFGSRESGFPAELILEIEGAAQPASGRSR